MKISEIITDKYKLRIPPTVYYDLLADVREVEEEQETTTKNDLGVDLISRADAIRAMQDKAKKLTNEDTINGLCGAVAILFELPSVTPQEPPIVSIAEIKYDEDKLKELVNKAVLTATPQEPQTFKWCTDCKEYDQEKHCCHRWSKVIRDTVEEIKQEPKTGHWIANAPQYDMLNPQYICSECGNAHTRTTPYCEMCGVKMVEPQESEAEDGNDG